MISFQTIKFFEGIGKIQSYQSQDFGNVNFFKKCVIARFITISLNLAYNKHPNDDYFLYFSVCSTTLWVGHLSKLVQDEDLSDTFGEYGEINAINIIPPRGCAFICMNRRMDASKALSKLHKTKILGKPMTVSRRG